MTVNKARLQLLRKAVAAKAAYWDAFRALELECTGGEEDFTDAHNDAVLAFVDELASNVTDPKKVAPCVKSADVAQLNVILGQD